MLLYIRFIFFLYPKKEITRKHDFPIRQWKANNSLHFSELDCCQQNYQSHSDHPGGTQRFLPFLETAWVYSYQSLLNCIDLVWRGIISLSG